MTGQVPEGSLRQELAGQLVRAAADFYRRGWCLATSGNFSAVLSPSPLRLLITRSGADKGALSAADLVVVDREGRPVEGEVGRPSAETLLHVAIAEVTGAAAVLHTHSVAATLLGERHLDRGAFSIRGYEMLKGLAGVETHETALRVPVFPNTQDIPTLAADVRLVLARFPDTRAFLIAGHGLYTWGRDVGEARRHVEALEFLLECEARRAGAFGNW